MLKKKFVIAVIIILALCVVLVKSFIQKDVYTSIEDYEKCIGSKSQYTDSIYANNMIWPENIADSVTVEQFYFKYYNPWDPNYLGYMETAYPDEKTYQSEIERLKSLESSDYSSFYGMSGFNKELCAILASDSGVVYALTEKKKKEIVYVLIEFCNYYTDIKDYKSIIGEENLPTGIDISKDNPTRIEFDKSTEEQN